LVSVSGTAFALRGVDRGRCDVRRLCAWCGEVMGYKAPLENPGTTHGICAPCGQRIRHEATGAAAPTPTVRRRKKSRRRLPPAKPRKPKAPERRDFSFASATLSPA